MGFDVVGLSVSLGVKALSWTSLLVFRFTVGMERTAREGAVQSQLDAWEEGLLRSLRSVLTVRKMLATV